MSEVANGYSLSHAHKFYQKKYGVKINKTLYRQICTAYNKKICEIAMSGRVVALPHGMGSLWVKKVQTNWDRPRVDLNETRLAGETVYHTNTHSDGWWCRWVWSRRVRLTPGMIYYSFDPTRLNSRALAKIMKTKNGYKRFFS